MEWFSQILEIPHTFSFFESPHRIAVTLAELRILLGERQIVVGRELTKRHQEFLRGSAEAVVDQLSEARGEITVVVGPLNTSDMLNDQELVGDAVANAVVMFGQLTNNGRSRRAALTEAARTFSVPARVVYAAVEEAKKSVE
jgi:16S rRNA (cytidine1402-2'-O)-methyltransferase